MIKSNLSQGISSSQRAPLLFFNEKQNRKLLGLTPDVLVGKWHIRRQERLRGKKQTGVRGECQLQEMEREMSLPSPWE